jgi:hypothetical protein
MFINCNKFELMKNKVLSFLILLLVTGGCNLFNKQKSPVVGYNSLSLKNLIIKAVSGDTNANNLLNGFTDLQLPVNNNFDTLIVDSLKIKTGKKFFVVLLNNPNPIYNRFAVYDSMLNIYLLDKSLNGYVNESIISLPIPEGTGGQGGISNGQAKNKTQIFVKVSESFISRDILSVNRMTLYGITDTSAFIAFRSYVRLSEPAQAGRPPVEFNQQIVSFSADRIITALSSTQNSPLSNKTDLFLYDFKSCRYTSSNLPTPEGMSGQAGNIFDNFVINQINNYNNTPDKPEITDKKSLYGSVGIDLGVDTIKNTGNIKSKSGYNLTLPDNWKSLNNLTVQDYLKKGIEGTKYINEVIGASIFIAALPPGDSAENYVNYKFNNSTAGKYLVKYIDKIISRKDFVQIFEYTCGLKKYLLILTASKYTYEQNKNDYQAIINSFVIN